jgi:hypothetical protein
MANYPWTIGLDVLALDWMTQGDEWGHWFSEELGKRCPGMGVLSITFDANTQPFVRLSLGDTSSSIDTVVLIGVSAQGTHVFAAGNEEPRSELIEHLSAASHSATMRMGDSGSQHAWTAILGYLPQRLSGLECVLAEEATVGHMRLESTDRMLVEPVGGVPPSLGSWSTRVSVPIRVHGTSRGYNWEAASATVARDLRTLCGLLSIELGAPIVVRESAAPLEWGERTVPEQLPWYRQSEGMTPPSTKSQQGVVLTKWLHPAWTRTRENQYLIAALDAFQEGLHLTDDHPSLAAVGFTAAVETIAGHLYKLPRCEKCRDKKKIGEAFRQTLEPFTNETTAELLRPIYNARSRTVHDGRLHGRETLPGLGYGPPWWHGPESVFGEQVLSALRVTTAKLLRWALTTALPPRQTLT